MSDSSISVLDTIGKRTERLASALFLVSNLIPETEISRTKIRSICLELLPVSLSLKDNKNYDLHMSLKTLERKILELNSILKILSISGVVSHMNANIISDELDMFLRQLKSIGDTYHSENILVSRSFFENGDALKFGKTDLMPANTPNVATPNFKKEKNNRKDQRSKDIIDLIAKKENVSIKDISAAIKGCGEKTVQRELNSLIRAGLVKKTGERRWSRYSLI